MLLFADFESLTVRRPPAVRRIPWAAVEFARLGAPRTLILCLRDGRTLSFRTRRAPELVRLAECVGVRVVR